MYLKWHICSFEDCFLFWGGEGGEESAVDEAASLGHEPHLDWTLVKTLWCILRNWKLKYRFHFLRSLPYSWVPFLTSSANGLFEISFVSSVYEFCFHTCNFSWSLKPFFITASDGPCKSKVFTAQQICQKNPKCQWLCGQRLGTGGTKIHAGYT